MTQELRSTYDESRHVEVHIATMSDGRNLAYERRGKPDSVPILGFHGSPGSRIGPWPQALYLYIAGIELLTFDRPGYGWSDPLPGRSIADTARDVEQLADRFGYERFCVVARSGGVPHALGCAALLKDRVSNVGVMVGLAPREELAKWDEGMGSFNAQTHAQATEDVAKMAAALRKIADATKDDAQHLIRSIDPMMYDSDRRIVGVGEALRHVTVQSHCEGLRQGGAGWIDDTVAVNRPWGFSISDIAAPTRIWHGEYDAFSPLEHSERLAAQIPNASLVIQPNASHFSSLIHLTDVLIWQRDNF